jgi:hypothetical protein
VTFSVTPLYGRILFRLLESAAMQDPAFRAWLRPAGEGGGAPLQAQLAELGRTLAALAGSAAFRDELRWQIFQRGLCRWPRGKDCDERSAASDG